MEQRLMACSTDELRAILRAMAQETSPTGRRLFLEKLAPPEDPVLHVAQIIQQDDLLAEIDDFSAELTNTIQTRLEPVYAEHLSSELLNSAQQEKFLGWCLDVAQRRAAAIVGNQHRKSYNKAATVTVACTEVLRLRGNQKEATSFVNDIRNQFPRHRAFQAELKAALQRTKSDLG